MQHHGWVGTGEELVRLSRAGRWDNLQARLTERYGRLLEAVNIVLGPPYSNLQARQREMFVRLGRILPELQQVPAAADAASAERLSVTCMKPGKSHKYGMTKANTSEVVSVLHGTL